jgi:hypothetical protein
MPGQISDRPLKTNHLSLMFIPPIADIEIFYALSRIHKPLFRSGVPTQHESGWLYGT